MSHARPWKESSEHVVHTTYTKPNIGGAAFLTRDTVARDLTSYFGIERAPERLATGDRNCWCKTYCTPS